MNMPATRKLFSVSRIVMRPKSRVLRGLIELGRYNIASAKPALPVHSHRNALEICFLVRGRQTYRVGPDFFSLRGGDLFLTFPDETHSTGGLPEEKGILYWMLLAVPRRGHPFLGLPPSEAGVLIRALTGIGKRHFRGSWKIKEHLDAFTVLHHETKNPLRACAMANRAVAFLLEVIACGRASPPPERPLGPVIEFIHNHLGDAPRIPELAERAGLSQARFKVRFKEETGVPPGEFVQRARIDEARRKLASGNEPVTRIAFDLGFNSSQYFATVFKRYTGLSPSDVMGRGPSP
jgi:AraC-like DNA-binding protein